MTLITLKDRSDFLDIQKNGDKWVSKTMVVQAKRTDRNDVRIGFTVSKKVDKRAVVRNRLKRRLREISREIILSQAQTGCDYILIGRQAAIDAPYETLLNDLRWCLKKMEYLGKDKT